MKYYKRILVAIIGIFFIGLGVAFNAGTLFGNDAIAIVYDGVRNVLKLSPSQIGMVSNFVNIAMIVILLFIGRKFVNIGTLVYILPFGTFVSLGTKIYTMVINQDSFAQRILAAVFGCTATYFGVALFIVVELGLDPFTGVVMAISEKIGWTFRKTKICYDIFLVVVGVLIGGKLGAITVITVLSAGPIIQFFAEKMKWIMREQPKVELEN